MQGKARTCGVSQAAYYLFVSLNEWQEMDSSDRSVTY